MAAWEKFKWLDQRQTAALFRAIPETKVRDRLLFGLAYRYGMRTHELIHLPAAAVDLEAGTIEIQGAKHGLRRKYPLFRELLPLCRAHTPGEEFYFTGRQGQLTRSRVWQLFKSYAKAARIPSGHGVHCLRHSAAVHLLDAGGGVEEVRDLLRHRDIQSSMEYAELSTKRRNGYLQMLDESSEIVRVA